MCVNLLYLPNTKNLSFPRYMLSLSQRKLGRGLLSLRVSHLRVKTSYATPSPSSIGSYNSTRFISCRFLHAFVRSILTARSAFGLGLRRVSVPPVGGLGVEMSPLPIRWRLSSRPYRHKKTPYERTILPRVKSS